MGSEWRLLQFLKLLLLLLCINGTTLLLVSQRCQCQAQQHPWTPPCVVPECQTFTTRSKVIAEMAAGNSRHAGASSCADVA